MARGWESKAVEEQIGAAEAEKDTRARRAFTREEIELEMRRKNLLLERTRLVREMERASKRRHLSLLERGLAYVDSELAKLEESNT